MEPAENTRILSRDRPVSGFLHARKITTQQLDDVRFIVPVGKAAQSFHGLVKANETAGFIVECLQSETTEEEIVDRMMEEYDVDRERAAAGVRKVVEKLKELDALT